MQLKAKHYLLLSFLSILLGSYYLFVTSDIYFLKNAKNPLEIYLRAFDVESSGNHNRALKLYMSAATRGDASAQRKVSENLIKNKKIKEGIRWLSKSAEQGDPSSIISLASNYKNGFHVEKDLVKVRYWLEKLSDKRGYLASSAQLSLGEMYFKGEGGLKDYSKARDLYLKGIDDSNFKGLNYSSFEEVEEHALEGNFIAQSVLGEYLYNKASGFWPNTNKNEYFKAREWFEKASEHGEPIAKLYLGTMYHDGLTVRKDTSKAKEYYESSVELGSIKAKVALGLFYLGRGSARSVLSDNPEVYNIPMLKFNSSFPNSHKNTISNRDKKLAKYWFGKACDNGNYSGCELFKRDF